MRASTRLAQRLLANTAPPTLTHLLPRRSALPLAQSPFPPRFAAARSPTLHSALRQASTQTTPVSSTSLANPSQATNQEPANPPPSYQLTFTCKPCSHRSSHRITKQGYHRGTVLITCPSCKNRHIISDHLKIFMDEKSTLEDILRRKAGPGTPFGKLLKKGQLGQRQGEMVGREGEEDIEFWEDGSESPHERKSE